MRASFARAWALSRPTRLPQHEMTQRGAAIIDAKARKALSFSLGALAFLGTGLGETVAQISQLLSRLAQLARFA
jgi:hypothetical protein